MNKYEITISNEDMELVFRAHATGYNPPLSWAESVARKYEYAHIKVHDQTNGQYFEKTIGE